MSAVRYAIMAGCVAFAYLAYFSGRHPGEWASNVGGAVVKGALWPATLAWEIVVLFWTAIRGIGAAVSDKQ